MSENWTSLVSRDEPPLWVSLIMSGMRQPLFSDQLGWPVSIKKYKYKDHLHSIGIDDFSSIEDYLAENAHDEAFFRRYLDACRAASENLENVAAQAEREWQQCPPDEFSQDELCALIQGYFRAARAAMPFMTTMVFVQDEMEFQARKAFGAALGCETNSPEVDVLLSEISFPNPSPAVIEETRSLKSISKKILNRYDQSKGASGLRDFAERDDITGNLIAEHCRKFGWLSTFAYRGQPYDADDIISRLVNYQREQHGKPRQQIFTSRKQKTKRAIERAYERVGNNASARAYLDLIREILFWRTERVDVHFRSECKVRPILKSFAVRNGAREDAFAYLDCDSIIDVSQADHGELAEALRKAKCESSFDLLYDDGEIFISRVDWKSRRKADKKKLQFEWPLIGSAACEGDVVGTARVVETENDIESVQHGDIIVTAMTTPSLMIAIEKCAGIVTDEGGIACHAAIISRELDIPCVINTEIGTCVIGDGDRLQVSARFPGSEVRLLSQGTRSPGQFKKERRRNDQQ